jgi:hypothetical protein
MEGKHLKPGDTFNDPEKIKLIIRDCHEKKHLLLIWQEPEGDPRKGGFCFGEIISYSNDVVNIKIRQVKKNPLDKSLKVNIFGQKYGVVGSIKILELPTSTVTIPIPTELTLTDRDFLYSKQIIALDDEERYLGLRINTRKRPNKAMWVNFKTSGKKSKKYALYDLSPRGIGILSDDVHDFEFDDEVEIGGIDNNQFDPPLKAIVKSIRSMKTKKFKIGLFFEKGNLASID